MLLNPNGLFQSGSVRISQGLVCLSLLCGWHFLLTTEQFDILLTWLWHRKACNESVAAHSELPPGFQVSAPGSFHPGLGTQGSPSCLARATPLSDWRWDRNQSRTFESCANPVRGSLTNRAWLDTPSSRVLGFSDQNEEMECYFSLTRKGFWSQAVVCTQRACPPCQYGFHMKAERAERVKETNTIPVKESLLFPRRLLRFNILLSLFFPAIALHWLSCAWRSRAADNAESHFNSIMRKAVFTPVSYLDRLRLGEDVQMWGDGQRPPYAYLLVCFLSRPIWVTSSALIPLGYQQSALVCLWVEEQTVLLQFTSLSPDTLRKKTWSPWQPQQARLSHSSQYQKLKKKFVIAKIRKRWSIQCGHVEKMNIKGTMTPIAVFRALT